MRIVSGTLKGRALRAPRHLGLRPTSDKVRQALFNVLIHGPPACNIEGARVIDLFAGTGALGLEALSRSAAYALFVEQDPNARALIQHHIQEFGLGGITRIFRRDATALGRAGPRDRFDLVFLDPPYAQALAERALVGLAEGGWLKEQAMIVVEEAATVPFTWPECFAPCDTRVYGDTQLLFARYVPGAEDNQPGSGPD